MAVYYQVPSQYAGKSLNQLSSTVNLPGIGPAKTNTGQFGGVNPDQPLTEGQFLTYTGATDPSSGEYQSGNTLFGTPMSEAQYQSMQQNNQIIKENQPAIEAGGSALTAANTAAGSAYSAYQGIKPTIEGSYQNIMNTITKGVNSTYASRGLSSDSPQFSLDLGNAELPAANAESGALNTFEQGLGQLLQGSADTAGNFLNLIGQLKSGAPLQTLQTGLSAANLPFQQAQTAAQTNLAQAQANAAQYIPIPYLGAINANTGKPISLGAGAGQNTTQTINGVNYVWNGSGWQVG